MQIVPTVYRALDPAETAGAVFAAFSLPGHPAPLSLVKILCALIWHETNGHPPGFGIGNVAAAGFVNGEEVSSWTGLAWRPPWFEIDDSSSERNKTIHAEMLAGREPSAFRAFSSIGEAVGSWRALMVRRFQSMLEAAARGDVRAFAHAYRDSGYCGNCDPDAAEAALNRRLGELEAKGAFAALPQGGVDMAPGGGILVAAAVVSVVTAVGIWISRRAA
jgi:hypothetical protein